VNQDELNDIYQRELLQELLIKSLRTIQDLQEQVEEEKRTCKKKEDQLQQQAALFQRCYEESLSQIEILFGVSQMDHSNFQDMVHYAIKAALELTSSELGWIGFPVSQELDFQIFSLTKDGFQEINYHPDRGTLFPILGFDLLAEAIQRKKPMVLEGCGKESGRKVCSADNVAVVPLFRDDSIVIVGCLGGKKAGYSGLDVNQFCLLLSSIGKAVQRRETKKRLRLTEEKLSKILEACPSAINLNRLSTGEYEQVNKSFERITGFSRHEVIGKTPFSVGLVDSKEFTELTKILKEKGYQNNFETKITTKTGNEKTILLSTEVFDLNGGKYVIGVFDDITQRKKIEREINRLERLNLIGQMAAGISHEIRNPLSVIRGFLQLLSEKEVDMKNQEYFSMMIEELDRANAILDGFLSLTRVYSPDMRWVNINDIVKNLFPLIEADAMIGDKMVDLELTSTPDLQLDEKEIRQMILNFCRNGLEAMTPGGILTIKTGHVDGGVVLGVSDQGLGIKPEIMDKIGTPFFTTKEKGTGLGLAVCYSIAARNGGSISIETGPEGTTFWVQFQL